jgi:hypothetical protein
MESGHDRGQCTDWIFLPQHRVGAGNHYLCHSDAVECVTKIYDPGYF